MAVAAQPSPPAVTYVVSSVTPIGQDLYQVDIQLPDGDKCYMVIPLSAVTYMNVLVSTLAVTQLAETKNGASPVIRPFG